MHLRSRTLLCSSIGGAILGAHATLLLLGHIAPWVFFNAVLGGFLIFVASRLALDMEERPIQEDQAPRAQDRS